MFEDLIECGICVKEFSNNIGDRYPKILSCLHSFCIKCLEDIVQTLPIKDKVICPLCRKETLIPTIEGIHGLQDNTYALKIINSLKQEDQCIHDHWVEDEKGDKVFQNGDGYLYRKQIFTDYIAALKLQERADGSHRSKYKDISTERTTATKFTK